MIVLFMLFSVLDCSNIGVAVSSFFNITDELCRIFIYCVVYRFRSYKKLIYLLGDLLYVSNVIVSGRILKCKVPEGLNHSTCWRRVRVMELQLV